MRRAAGVLIRCALAIGAAIGFGVSTGAKAEAANNCYSATSKAAHALCFLDFTGFSGSGAQAFTFKLSDGSLLTGTITNTGTTAPPVTVPIVYNGAPSTVFAFGNSAYVGVAGEPAFYSTATGSSVGPFVFSNVVLTDTQGRVSTAVTIAGVDAESTDSAEVNNQTTAMVWATTGTNLALLQTMPSTGGGTTPVCTLHGLGTGNAYCQAGTANSPVAADILTSTITKAQTFSMSAMTSGGKQGFAFALQASQLTVTKAVASRENTTDEFQVQLVTAGGTAFATGTTNGAGTTASASGSVVPGTAYTLKEVATSGSLANYVSTVACVNAVASSTTLPAANSVATSVSITPAVDDQITCTFTNTALTLTDTAGTAQAIAPGNAVTDTFTLKNTSGVAGTFQVVQPTVVAANGTNLTPTGYVFKGTTYATLGALQGAINAAGATAAAGSITVGVSYVAPSTDGATIVTTLPATLVSGTSASPQATASETDTMPYAVLTISKTGTTNSSPGGAIDYTIVVSNTGPNAANGAAFSDPFPTGVAVVGTPKCSAGGTAVCGTVTVSPGTPPTVSSVITTLPSGTSVTFTISATAAASGTYVNTASVAPPAGTGGGPQTSSLSTTVTAANGLVKTVRNLNNVGEAPSAGDNGKPGNTLQYGLTFTNTTGSPITGLRFDDPLPAQTTYVSSACPAASTTLPAGITGCTPSTATTTIGGVTTTTVTFTFAGTLAAGSSVSVTLNVLIK